MRNEIIDELSDKIKEGRGCIVFDFGCYFPYSNWKDILTFKFELGAEKLDSYKLNHRYPNSGYATISKKTGRKLSKIGYPYFCELNVTHHTLLAIEFGIMSETVKLIFPIDFSLTDDLPVCGLTFHLNFKNFKDGGKPLFSFSSCCKRTEDAGWDQFIWTNDDGKEQGERTIIMPPPLSLEDSTLLYSNVLKPFPQKLGELLML